VAFDNNRYDLGKIKLISTGIFLQRRGGADTCISDFGDRATLEAYS